MIARTPLNIGLALCYHVNQENPTIFSSLKQINDINENKEIQLDETQNDSLQKVITTVEKIGDLFDLFLKTQTSSSEDENLTMNYNERRSSCNNFIEFAQTLPESIQIVNCIFNSLDVFSAVEKIHKLTENNNEVIFEDFTEIVCPASEEQPAETRTYLRIANPKPQPKSQCIVS